MLPLLLLAAPAQAEEREFCADRPGLGTPACTVAPGQVMAELGVLGWDHSADPGSVEDDLALGDLLIRTGLHQSTEIEFGVTTWTTIRTRDRASGTVSRTSGIGDMTLAVRHNFGGGTGPTAIHAFVTLPTGKDGIGAGDWGAGILLPTGFDLPGGFELDLTPELDAAVNASGSGRHFAWGGVVGLSHPLGKALSLEAELGASRDLDPGGHSTDARAALSLAWQAGPNWQIDFEANAGLSEAAPRHSLMFGLARRF
ncbi:MAG: transporter [Novosphingobium sp.]